MSKPFGTMPARFDPHNVASPRVAVVLPGAGYSPAHPLLEFGRQALLQHGWTVQQIWWDRPHDTGDDELAAWVCEQTRTAIEAEREACRVLLLAKSLGTLAAPVAADYGLDAIWMTPLLRSPSVVEAIARNAAAGRRQLLVGGTADAAWDAETARTLGCDVVELPGASHIVAVPDDAVSSAELHVVVTRAVDTFLASLDLLDP